MKAKHFCAIASLAIGAVIVGGLQIVANAQPKLVLIETTTRFQTEVDGERVECETRRDHIDDVTTTSC